MEVDGLYFNQTKYAGLTPVHDFVTFMCNRGDMLNYRVRRTLQLAVANKCASAVGIFNKATEVKRIPGALARMYHGVGDELPFALCEMVPGEKAGYISTSHFLPTQSANYTIRATLTLDPNPWITMYDNWFYQLFWRGLGLFYLAFAGYVYICFRFRMKAPTKNKVPELLLAIEGVRSVLLGLHFVIGSMWGEDIYPTELALGNITCLTGMGKRPSLQHERARAK